MVLVPDTSRRESHVQRRRDWTWFWLFWLALALRMAYLPRAQVLQTEGTTYVTLARHLLHGHEYVGILGEKELVMVSIFPHLIAFLGALIGHLVTAGRVWALLAGAGLVIPTYALGKAMFNRRVGVWAALLVAFHPYLLVYAPLVRVEMPFMFAWLCGIYATWRAIEQGPRQGWWIAMPLCFGGAYLLKSEGAVYFALSFALLALVWARRYPLKVWMSALLLVGTLFLLLTTPMIAWLSAQTGRFTPDTKGIINYTIAIRIAHGMDYHHAAYGLAEGGAPAGPLLDRNRMVKLGVGQKRPALSDPAYRRGMVATLRKELRLLRWPLLGYIWLGLAGLGFLLALIRGEGWATFFPLWYLLPAFFGVSTILFVWTRYLLPIIPLTALWAGYGIEALSDMLAGVWNTSPRTAWRVRRVVGGLLLLLTIGLHPYARTAWVERTTVHDLEQQQAGRWLLTHDPNPEKRIMSTTSQVPYYARGIHVPMPVDSPDLIVQYAARRHVDYVIISAVKDRGRPTAVWLDPNKAPPEWDPIFTNENSPYPRILIYRITQHDCGCGGK